MEEGTARAKAELRVIRRAELLVGQSRQLGVTAGVEEATEFLSALDRAKKYRRRYSRRRTNRCRS